MKDITDTVNDVCHVLFLWDKLCHKVVHAYVNNHSDSNVNTCTCATLWQSLSHKESNQIFPCAACLIQIRGHHHIDIYADIYKMMNCSFVRPWYSYPYFSKIECHIQPDEEISKFVHRWCWAIEPTSWILHVIYFHVSHWNTLSYGINRSYFEWFTTICSILPHV